ncbi:hypothetical protein BZL41_27805 [Pseudomonas sp. PIC25]|uniref:hypothetical protein n=1 Tax=Pseudomonas sp. PIC25 TaxID=1958773 RepID=UPI000BAB6ADB|nr:hypothetical protein [Pseudomonas sp. PIC25]PAU50935.1 hypothetical protein BZL41_27805 [Pseudomonas sp. PIC25]
MRNFLRGADGRLRQLVAFAVSEGWSVSRTAGGHIKFSKAGHASIFTSCTASDHRADLNALARLRRAERGQSQPSQEAI